MSKLTNYSLREIHAIILAMRTATAAARALGVRPKTLNAYLGRLRFLNGSTVSVVGLLIRTPAQAREEFPGCYDTVVEVPRIPLESRTLAYIHYIIRKNKTATAAAGALGVCSTTLNAYLGRWSFSDGTPVSVAALLTITPARAREEFFGYYDTVVVVARIPLESHTLAYIHDIILKKTTAAAAAAALGVGPQTLNAYLSRLRFSDGTTVSFEGLFTRTVEQAREEFPGCYDTVVEVSRKRRRVDALNDRQNCPVSVIGSTAELAAAAALPSSQPPLLASTNSKNRFFKPVPTGSSIVGVMGDTPEEAAATELPPSLLPLTTMADYVEGPMKPPILSSDSYDRLIIDEFLEGDLIGDFLSQTDLLDLTNTDSTLCPS